MEQSSQMNNAWAIANKMLGLSSVLWSNRGYLLDSKHCFLFMSFA